MVYFQRGADLDTIDNCLSGKLEGFRRLVALTMALVLIMSLASSPAASASPAVMASNNPPTYNNNLDNIIAEIFDEADDRLRRSKINNARQVKQTLRFGRRSDPWMATTYPEQMTIEELQNKLYGNLN